MKARAVFLGICTLFILTLLVGCDPIYPSGDLKVARMQPLSQGESINIVIVYPANGLITSGWKNQNIEIISGGDIVTVSGLSITGIKSGSATIKVNATTMLNDGAAKAGHKEKVYSTQVKIKVK